MAGVPLLNGFLSKEMFFAETLHQQVLGSMSWLIPVLATIAGAFRSRILRALFMMCFLTATQLIYLVCQDIEPNTC